MEHQDYTHIIRVERRKRVVINGEPVWMHPWTNDVRFNGTRVEAVDMAGALLAKDQVRSVAIFDRERS